MVQSLRKYGGEHSFLDIDQVMALSSARRRSQMTALMQATKLNQDALCVRPVRNRGDRVGGLGERK